MGTLRESTQPNRKGCRVDGFTLLEVVIATAVLLVGSLGFLSLFGAAADVGRSSRETAIAADAAQRVLETLESYEPQPLVALLHNSETSDDPPGWEPVPGLEGPAFAVDGLEVPDGDPDGFVGEVVFPFDPFTGQRQRGVDDYDVDLVQPFVSRMRFGPDMAGFELVPVIVRIEWNAGGRVRSHQVVGVLSPL